MSVSQKWAQALSNTIKLTQDIQLQFHCVMTKLSLGSVTITYGVLGSVEVQWRVIGFPLRRVSAGAKTERFFSAGPRSLHYQTIFATHSLVPYPSEPLWRRGVAVGVIGFCQSVGEGISQHGKKMLDAYLSTSKQSVSVVAFFHL